MTESQPQDTQAPSRAPYAAPTVEELGAWSTLTLQQTVPISPDFESSLQQNVLKQSW